MEGMPTGGLSAVLMKRSAAMPDARPPALHEVITIHSLLVESYNRDLERIGSVARVALPTDPANEGMLSLHADAGAFLALIPFDTAPALRNVRNRFGPTWLYRLSPGQLDAAISRLAADGDTPRTGSEEGRK